MIRFNVIKVGTTYGPHYVNHMYNSLKENICEPFTLVCWTDNGEGIMNEINLRLVKNPERKQWIKYEIYNEPSYRSINFIIDLDVVILKNIDPLIRLVRRNPDVFWMTSKWWTHQPGYDVNGAFYAWSTSINTKPIHDEFEKSPDRWMSRYREGRLATGHLNGEQNSIQDILRKLNIPYAMFPRESTYKCSPDLDQMTSVQDSYLKLTGKNIDFFDPINPPEGFFTAHFCNTDDRITLIEDFDHVEWIEKLWK